MFGYAEGDKDVELAKLNPNVVKIENSITPIIDKETWERVQTRMSTNKRNAANKAKREYNLDGAVLVCDPVPAQYALDKDYINAEIDKALAEMEEKGIKGKEETPFLLSKIVSLTGGKSLETNIKLILNNAKLGAEIAVAYSKLKD